jgi:cytochrome P450
MASGKIEPCFATYITEKQKEYDLSDDEVAYLCGSIFGAGSDTSASAIAICVMAAAMYPEEQKKVREELDRVVGQNRAPNFEDLDDLP